MHLFYCPALADGVMELPEEEAHHAVHVLRVRAGDRVGLLDGRGARAEAEVLDASKRGCSVQVAHLARSAKDPAEGLHIAVAPTKQMERFEWFLEKATEIGIGRITPVLTTRTERAKLRHDRMERVLVSAIKQSQRVWLPQLDALTSLSELATASTPQRFFGWCEGTHEAFTQAYRPGPAALMLIGPEGDFTPEEADLLRGKGFTAVSLGEARLRTETAALAACTWMSLRK
ncbi:MAG TPA: RsmE family RNA methyltransferase [Flavobacteriales bacterium]|jgi:16S rRNA (uracil1498-N3)-methyltransferase|nr:RsmE family RNA methyltransferase [Flavobacteriales bacterium]